MLQEETMIRVVKNNPKNWIILRDGKEIIDITLTSPTIANRFTIIVDFIENLSDHFGDEFDDWFENYLISTSKEVSSGKHDEIRKNIPILKDFVNRYLFDKKADFSKFVDETKSKKGSILFTKEDIEKIVKTSHYLKLYTVVSNDVRFKLNYDLSRKIYNELTMDISGDIIEKIYNVVKTKTFRYNLTDRYMWDYIKSVQNKTIDSHVIEIFNFIMSNILVVCQEDKNPITYFTTVIDQSVKWFLRSVYKTTVVYDESITTEELQGEEEDKIKNYFYNETLSKLKRIGYDLSVKYLESFDKVLTFSDPDQDSSLDNRITTFQRELSKVEYASPLWECLAAPILSRVTQIPYNYFKTVSAENSTILCLYMQYVLSKVFKNDYKTLINMLSYYPTKEGVFATSGYNVKKTGDYLNSMSKRKVFESFDGKVYIVRDLLGYYIGRISRGDFVNVLTGERLSGLPITKIERELAFFLVYYFTNGLEDKIEEVEKIVDQDLSS